jgi:3-phosphoglycerate kinase
MGGSKVEDKLKLLDVISRKADTLLLGGKLANEYQKRKIELSGKARVIIPVEGDELLDIGEGTSKIFAEEISKAQTVIWNGPMGKVEDEQYRAGTHKLYEALIENEPADVIVGGGDTLAAISDEAHLERIDYVSTGGGAMLKLIETGTLVGLEVLKIT